MKRFIIAVLTVVATAVLMSGFSPSAWADHHEKDKKSETATTKKKRAYPFRGKIGAIDKDAKSITLHGKEKSRTFYLTSKTKIQKHGKPATLNDAVIGEEIGGSVLPDTTGKLTLKSVRFGPKPPTEKKDTKTKNDKK